MIKTINGGGRYISVTGSPGSTYVNNYSGMQGVGNMRYNTSSQNIEVYDGSNWIQMQTGYASVAMTPEAESLLDWAKQKRNEEFESEQLAKSNPTIADLLAQKNKIDEQISIVKTLIKSETTT
jgi:hypothetical protein